MIGQFKACEPSISNPVLTDHKSLDRLSEHDVELVVAKQCVAPASDHECGFELVRVRVGAECALDELVRRHVNAEGELVNAFGGRGGDLGAKELGGGGSLTLKRPSRIRTV